MKLVSILFIVTILSTSVIAQGERKLNKNFSFVFTGKDSITAFKITQRAKHSGWGELYGALSQELITSDFRVITEGANNANTYIIEIDYSRGFSASKMQYSDLRGQILNPTGSEIIGTFGYEGRFNPDDISKAIALKLSKTVQK